jgi:ribosomal protein L11
VACYYGKAQEKVTISPALSPQDLRALKFKEMYESCTSLANRELTVSIIIIRHDARRMLFGVNRCSTSSTPSDKVLTVEHKVVEKTSDGLYDEEFNRIKCKQCFNNNTKYL